MILLVDQIGRQHSFALDESLFSFLHEQLCAKQRLEWRSLDIGPLGFWTKQGLYRILDQGMQEELWPSYLESHPVYQMRPLVKGYVLEPTV